MLVPDNANTLLESCFSQERETLRVEMQLWKEQVEAYRKGKIPEESKQAFIDFYRSFD